MSFETYILLHIIGIGLLIASISGLSVHAIVSQDKKEPLRKLLFIIHGIGLFLVLLGGFGMLARISIHWPWPNWVKLKFLIWVIFGGLSSLLYISRTINKAIYISAPLLFICAWYLANYQPF